MKNYKNIFLFLSVFLAFSCEDDVLGLNDDPNIFTSVPGELQIGTAELSAIKLASSDASRYSAVFAGHATGAGAQFVNTQVYDVTSGDFSDLWGDAYQEGLTQAREVASRAEESGNDVLRGVALIIESIHLGELATFFGDIPNTQAGDQINFPNPQFDEQQSVLGDVQAKLTEAISLVGGAPGTIYATGLSTSSTWAQVAHGLKARYYLIAKDYTNALAEAQMSFSTVGSGLVSVQQDVVGAKNFWYQFGVDQRAGNVIGAGSYLFKMLNPDDASVQRMLATPGDAERFEFYYNNVDGEMNYSGVFAPDASFPIINWYEVRFIEAEAQYRNGNESGARDVFNQVRNQLGVEYSSSFPETTTSGGDLLKEILEEKYITLFCSGQTFHDLARTNNLINIQPTSGTELPARFLYPQSEINNNTNTPDPRPGLFSPTPINQ